MATIFTSNLEVHSNGMIDIEIDQIDRKPGLHLKSERYSSSDVLIGEIVCVKSYIENYNPTKTRIRAYFSNESLLNGDKIKIKVVDFDD